MLKILQVVLGGKILCFIFKILLFFSSTNNCGHNEDIVLECRKPVNGKHKKLELNFYFLLINKNQNPLIGWQEWEACSQDCGNKGTRTRDYRCFGGYGSRGYNQCLSDKPDPTTSKNLYQDTCNRGMVFI